MSDSARSDFEPFASAFVRAYWECVQNGAFPMPPDEPVEETLDELLAEISFQTSGDVLEMENTHGDRWSFGFRWRGGRWELIEASCDSDGGSPSDLLGPVYAEHFEPMLRHVERKANERAG
ncbi:MAG: hypothetical protein RL885_32255 [Planctomycetota bacterium]